MAVYSSRNAKNYEKGITAPKTWQGALVSGNTAVALRYVGQLVATGIVVSATSLVVDGDAHLAAIALRWSATALTLTLAIWIGYRLFLPLVLFRVNVAEEVDHQRNLGVAAVEAAFLIGLALMASSYIA